MTSDAPPASAAVSGEDLFYADLQPLDPVRFEKLGMLRTDNPFGFAAKQQVVPLQVHEFGISALCYPIIFAGEARAPLAVMGINAGENLFASADGRFRHGAYVPAFLRRYPFATALNEQANRLFYFIDRACPLFTEDEPEILLFENGEPSAFTQGCIEFCRRYDADQRITVSFVKQLSDLDLFDIRRTTFTPRRPDGSADEPRPIAEYFVVSEEKLKALAPQKLAQLRDNGALAAIYAHLLSLQVWDRLIQESLARAAAAPTLS